MTINVIIKNDHTVDNSEKAIEIRDKDSSPDVLLKSGESKVFTIYEGKKLEIVEVSNPDYKAPEPEPKAPAAEGEAQG